MNNLCTPLRIIFEPFALCQRPTGLVLCRAMKSICRLNFIFFERCQSCNNNSTNRSKTSGLRRLWPLQARLRNGSEPRHFLSFIGDASRRPAQGPQSSNRTLNCGSLTKHLYTSSDKNFHLPLRASVFLGLASNQLFKHSKMSDCQTSCIRISHSLVPGASANRR
jgi:hypothetical protein